MITPADTAREDQRVAAVTEAVEALLAAFRTDPDTSLVRRAFLVNVAAGGFSDPFVGVCAIAASALTRLQPALGTDPVHDRLGGSSQP